MAHLIGCNRSILVGCAEPHEGVTPCYQQDGSNDDQTVNASFIRRFSSRERETPVAELASSLSALTNFLTTVREAEWNTDSRVVHYRGGLARVARCIDSLVRDDRSQRQEMLQARPLKARNVCTAHPGTAGEIVLQGGAAR